MKQLSSLDLFYLTREFKTLENNRIDSFFYTNDIFYIQVYVKSQGKKFLTIKPGKFIYLGFEKQESNFPSSFVQYLRKYFKNTYITEISQIPQERILKITIEKKIDEEKTEINYLFLEFYGIGNIILTDKDFVIKNSLIKRTFKDRAVQVYKKYDLPISNNLNLFDINFDNLSEEFKKSDLSIVKFIALKYGIGGRFSEYILSKVGIDKNKLTIDLNEEEQKQIFDNLVKLPNLEIVAQVSYGKDEKVEDFFPYEFTGFENLEKQESYNKALELYYKQFLEKIDERQKEYDLKLKRLNERLQKQELQVEEIEKGGDKFNEIGNKIYENYELIENLLISINKSAKEKGWEYIENKIKETPELSKIIKKLNYKDNEIVLDLE